jgi:adenylate cyclase
MQQRTEWHGKLMSLDVRAADAARQLTLQLKDALACDRATFFRVDTEKGEVYSVAATVLEIAEIRLPMRRGVVGFVARTGRTLNLKDVYNDPRFDRSTDQKTGYRSRSMLTMAVREPDGTIVGVLQALNKASDLFLPNDEAVMAQFCAEALKVIHART